MKWKAFEPKTNWTIIVPRSSFEKQSVFVEYANHQKAYVTHAKLTTRSYLFALSQDLT